MMSDKVNIHRGNYIDYIKELSIPATSKEHLCDEKYFSKHAKYYFYFPLVFAKAFGIKHDFEALPLLSIAIYLYFRAIKYKDTLFDDSAASKKGLNTELIFTINVCEEECVKILTGVFGLKSHFWDLWNRHKEDLKNSVILEHSDKRHLPFEDYEKLIECKYSFSKSPLDCLHILSGQQHEQTYADLLESLRCFNMGQQIADDVDDFKVDIQDGLLSYPYLRIKQFLDDRGIDHRNFEVNMYNTYLYLSGIAQELYKTSLDYFHKSSDIALTYNLDLWVEENQIKINSVSAALKTVEDYMAEVRTKMRKPMNGRIR